MWDDQFSRFAMHHKVISYDARGFGKSGTPVKGETCRHEEAFRRAIAERIVDKARRELTKQSKGRSM